MRRGRARFAATQIRDDDVRSLVAFLKRGGTVVYVPDQTYLGSQSGLLPFFGEPAMTNMATSKLARITGARVLPYTFKRVDAGPRYVVDIAPPLEAFPTATRARHAPACDAARELDSRRARAILVGLSQVQRPAGTAPRPVRHTP